MTSDELVVGDKVFYIGVTSGVQIPGAIEEKHETFAWIKRGGSSTAIFYEDIIEKDTHVEIPWGTVERSDPKPGLRWDGTSPWSSTAYYAGNPAGD